jgi:hypothetical protein
VGYEQRRRIRAQIRIAKKKMETNTNTYTKTTKHNTLTVTKPKSPERQYTSKSPERQPKLTPQKTHSPDRQPKGIPQKPAPDHIQPETIANGDIKQPRIVHEHQQRSRSPEKLKSNLQSTPKTPVRQPSPDKKTRAISPSKLVVTKPKTNRFTEYATAYLKKTGINDVEKVKLAETRIKKTVDVSDRRMVSEEEHKISESKSTISKVQRNRATVKDTVNIVHVNGKRTPSPEKKSPERKNSTQNERLREKSPSPVLKRQISDTGNKETIIKTVYEGDKKLQPKQTPVEKPSWVTNRNLKKITSETRSFSSKKIETEKPKYRAPSPSKVISKPIDVITSSYGPGPLDADGKPLFGIKALRNGASNYQGIVWHNSMTHSQSSNKYLHK